MSGPRRNKTPILQKLADYRSIEGGFVLWLNGGDDLILAPIGKQNICAVADVHGNNASPVGELIIPLQLHQINNRPAVLKKLYSRDVKLAQFLVCHCYRCKPIVDGEVAGGKPDRSRGKRDFNCKCFLKFFFNAFPNHTQIITQYRFTIFPDAAQIDRLFDLPWASMVALSESIEALKNRTSKPLMSTLAEMRQNDLRLATYCPQAGTPGS